MPAQVPVGDHVVDRLEGQVGVHRGRAVADQQRDVVHLAAVAGLDDQPDLGARTLPDQVLVHDRGHQQRRDRRVLVVTVAVGQDQDAGARGDGLRTVALDPLQRAGQGRSAAVDAVTAVDQRAFEAGLVAVGVDVPDAGQVVVVDHRTRQRDLPARRRARVEQVALGADRAGQRRHQLLADRVQRRVGDLGEELGEVVVEHPRPLRQPGHRRVRAHRAQRLGAGRGHRRHQDAQVLLGVAEQQLTPGHRLVGVHDVLARRQVLQRHQARRAATRRTGARRRAGT